MCLAHQYNLSSLSELEFVIPHSTVFSMNLYLQNWQTYLFQVADKNVEQNQKFYYLEESVQFINK